MGLYVEGYSPLEKIHAYIVIPEYTSLFSDMAVYKNRIKQRKKNNLFAYSKYTKVHVFRKLIMLQYVYNSVPDLEGSFWRYIPRRCLYRYLVVAKWTDEFQNQWKRATIIR